MGGLEFLLISIPIILATISLHEFAHAKVADLLGDPTPRLAGRLTLNPLNHIDPIGFFMLLLVRFGWAKPVPLNPYNFADPKKGMALVGAAGPLANFLFAWVLAIIFKNLPHFYPPFITSIFAYTIWINLALGVFNLIPIPPLDGSRILAGLLPYDKQEFLYQLEQYGFLFLITLVFFGSSLLFTVVQFLYQLLV